MIMSTNRVPMTKHPRPLHRPTPSRFVIDPGDGPIISLDGFDNGERWNGYCCPLVEASQAILLTEAFKRGDVLDESATWDFDRERNVILMTYNGEISTIEGNGVECADGVTRHLFDVGFAMVWEAR